MGSEMIQGQSELISRQVRMEVQETRSEAREWALRQDQRQDQKQAGDEEKNQQQIQEEAQRRLRQAQADEVADGRAVQQVIPARETYKARRAERRRVREAQRIVDWGEKNDVAKRIKVRLEEYNKQLTNSYESYFLSKESDQSGKQEMDLTKNKSGVDLQVLRCFSHGFEKDKAGNPATEKDMRYQLEDAAFYDAFCSTDYVRRTPYLHRMVEEVFNYYLRDDTFSDYSMKYSAEELQSMTSRMACMEKLMKDENNAFFFNELLSSEKKKALEGALEVFNLTSSLFTEECRKRGVEPNEGDVHYIGKKNNAAYSKSAQEYLEQYQKAQKIYKDNKFTRLRLGAAVPDSKTYQQIRSLLNDDVQKILDCDIQKLLDCDLEKLYTLSDEKLQQKREEINKLYAISLNVKKCLTLKSPDQFMRYSNDTTRLERSSGTLKEDLIGQRILEYEYKSGLIEGLAERAAGYGNSTMYRATTLYKERMTPTYARHEFMRDVIKRHQPDFQEGIVNDPRFVDVVKEFYASREDLEIIAARDVEWRRSHYIKYSRENPMGWSSKPPKTIGETLFRNLVSFLNVEATQTLLTPEQFKKMLLDLEKGHGGESTLRKVIEARYDMLERKYGSSIENLTVQDVMEHFVDMGKDFANIQMDLYLIERFPDFTRDKRLIEQIRYYNAYARYVFNMIKDFSANNSYYHVGTDDAFKVEHPDEVVTSTFSDWEGRNGLKEARDALMENKGFLKDRPDWSQKVKKPRETTWRTVSQGDHWRVSVGKPW